MLLLLLWPLTVLAALAGWGRLAQRALRLDARTPAAWLLSPAWGIAAVSFLGGILNLFSLANRPVLISSVLLGALLLLIDAIGSLSAARAAWKSARRDAPFLFLAIVVIVLLGLRFTASLGATFNASPQFKDIVLNPHDDMHSYLVSAERLLQTGTLGDDPFNSRLMMSSLGTQPVLNAAALALLPEDALHVVDGGVGLIALALATAGLALRLRLPRALAAAAMVVPLAIHFGFINLSANATAAAALTVLIACALEELPVAARPQLLWSLRLGFLLASACALKGTLLFPACVFGFALFLLAQRLERRLLVLLTGLLALAAAAVALLPWMIWQFHNSGTPLYPLLGKGFHAESFGLLPFPPLSALPQPAADHLYAGIPLPSLLLLLGIVGLLLPATRRRADARAWSALLAFLLAWLLTWPVLAYATQMIDLPRYLTPTTAAGIAVALAFAFHLAAAFTAGRPASRARLVAPLALAAVALLTARDWTTNYFILLPEHLARLASNPLPVRGPHNALATQIQQLQSAVPPGQPLLVYLGQPAFLNFTRNPIYVLDWPGESSLPPGLPVYSGGAAVRDYLLAHHIRYLAYAYRTHANFPPENYSNYLQPENGNVVRRQAAGSFAFQQDLAQLQPHVRTLYNDGTNEIFDLASPATSSATR